MELENVGRYRIVRRLGSGGFGEVFLAEDPTLQRRVALKILSAADEKSKRRFVREAITASQLSHPNVAVVYEAAESDGVAYIAMQHVDGETLRDRLARGRLSPAEIVRIAREVADALDDAHRHGIVHRDVKPGNIMLDARGHAKVLDFGLAKIAEDASYGEATDVKETTAGKFLGTMQYVSPEQGGGHAVDARSDIFSFGIVLYEMISGKNPFAAPTFVETIRRVCEMTPPPLDTTPQLKRVVTKCLEKNPERRYQSAREIVNDLDAVDTPSHGGARLWLGASAVVLIAAIAGIAWFASRRPQAAPPAIRTKIDSIAVLPFVNFSPERENEFIGDGISEEVINGLAQIRGLKVTSRTSSFALKGKGEDIRAVGQSLGVDAVVEGSVQRAGDRLRVTAQLINAHDGYHLWSQTYNGAVADIFSIEDQISRSVANAIQRQISGSLTGPATRDLEAYDLYLKARHDQAIWTRESFEDAIAYFRAAIARDPSFAEAYAGMAETYSLMDHRHGLTTLKPAELYKLAIEAASKALTLNPDSAEAHAAIGHIDLHLGKFPEAERELNRALQINPNSSIALSWNSVLMRIEQKRSDLVRSQCAQARDIDPASILVLRVCSTNLWALGDFTAAADYAKRAIDLDPNYDEPYLLLVRADALLGRFPEAQQALDRAQALPDVTPTIGEDRAMLFAASGHQAEAVKLLRDIEARGTYSTSGMVRAWATTGDVDETLKWINRMVADDPQYLRSQITLPPHPLYAKLRSDPRYIAARQKLGLPPLMQP